MATGKVIGQIQAVSGDIKIVGVDGSVREAKVGALMYEKEQIVSSDSSALFQIKFLAIPEAAVYSGAFRILADGSVIQGKDAIDSVASDESLSSILKSADAKDAKALETAAGEDIDDLETAAGEEGAEGGSSFTETDIVASSSVLGFSRGANTPLGFGIVDFGTRESYDPLEVEESSVEPPVVPPIEPPVIEPVIPPVEPPVVPPIEPPVVPPIEPPVVPPVIPPVEPPVIKYPVISSDNNVVYDENGTKPVIQVSASGDSVISYSISGLDSDKFSIDATTGLLTFNDSPDYEKPQDLGGNNEYNVYITATDASGNYTTQLLSVFINNVNEAVTAFDDVVNAVEDVILNSTIDLDANDEDLDDTELNRDALTVKAGTYSTLEGGSIVIAADGSYTYTPPTNFSGVDSVEYTVTDGEFEANGTLRINVIPASDLPNLGMDITETQKTVPIVIEESVIDTERNEAEGIYEGEDGKYYKNILVEDDNSIKEILNTGSKLELSQSVGLADIAELDIKISGKNTSGSAEFFNGTLSVGTLPLADGVNSYNPDGSFDSIVFTINVDDHGAIHLDNYSIISEVQPYWTEPVMGESTVYDYTIAVTAASTDSSETLSDIELDGIPDGVTLVDSGDGVYTFSSEVQLSPEELDDITATIASIETDEADISSIIVNQNGIVSIEAGIGDDTIVYDNSDMNVDGGEGSDKLIVESEDIDYSNISNIEELDLSSSDYTLSSITLDDVLDITDGDKVLKITGESGDGISGLADNGWQIDDAPSVTEAGYITYTNIEDSTVQLLIDEDILIVTD